MADTIDKTFETIENNAYSGHKSSGEYAIRNEEEWNTLWNQVTADRIPQPKAPSVDFETQMVLGVFLGERTSGGYSIEISRIRETENSLEVYVTEKTPQFGMMSASALSQPCHLIKTGLTKKEVKYIR